MIVAYTFYVITIRRSEKEANEQRGLLTSG